MSIANAGSLRLALLLGLCGLPACRCGPPSVEPPEDAGLPDASVPPDTGRCDTPLDAYRVMGKGLARLRRMSAQDALPGPTAAGGAGDFLLENTVVRAVVQGEDRHIGPVPWGGSLLDLDLVGHDSDQFGELGLLYNFGRTLKPTRFDLLDDGSVSGSAVLAVTGDDTPNDYLSLRNQLVATFGNVPAADPALPVPLRLTTYFILNAGEPRVRILTAFCNSSDTQQLLAVGDNIDPGHVLELFNPQSCTPGFGYGGACAGLDRMSWFGYQGDGVAFGYAPWKVNAPLVAEATNGMLTVAGISGVIVGTPGLSGMLSWFDLDAGTRDGQLILPPRGHGLLLRDVWVGRDLGEVGNAIARVRNASSNLAQVSGTVRAAGQPLAGARVVFEAVGQRAVFMTAADGSYTGLLPALAWKGSAWAPGRLPTATVPLNPQPATPTTLDFDVGPTRTLTVTVQEATRSNAAVPAKVTVLCKAVPCSWPQRSLALFSDTPKDPLPDFIRAIGHVPASGTLTLSLPPGEYEILVSRGPEYSVFPNGYPTTPPYAVDLRTKDAAVTARLARVIDSADHMSADFHVHAVQSPDSIVSNAERVLSFAAEGVDVVVATDHDHVTDLAPWVKAQALTPWLASIVGEEVSTMDYGHYNLFPMTPDTSDRISRGAVDWAGGAGPTLTVAQIFEEARSRGVRTVHFSHPRGFLGGLTLLRADTDTFATHARPEDFNMVPPAGATAANSRLLSTAFNSLEVLNGAEDALDPSHARALFNDWFTLLSRGILVAGSGVSDTHARSLSTTWRTWVRVGLDEPNALTAEVLSTHVNALRAFVSNGPYIDVSATRLDPSGNPTGARARAGDTLAASASPLRVTLDLQVPEYLDVSRIELYMHQPQDDGACPLLPGSPNYATSRVACNGQANANWPASGITAQKTVTLAPADLKTVFTDGATSWKAWRKTVSFDLPAPTEDNWVVAMVYGEGTLFPLTTPPPSLTGASTPARPFAFSNPIFIDADGNGYDKPPFKVKIGLPSQSPAPPAPSRPSTEEEVHRRWHERFGHH